MLSATQTDWGALAAVCASIIGGAMAMAWRLGGLERRVKDMDDRLGHLEDDLAGRVTRPPASRWGTGR